MSCGCLLFIIVLIAIYYGISSAWSGTKKLLGFPTATPYVADCHRWEEINYSMVGQWECVYGTVVSMLAEEGTGTAIKFSSQSGTFFLLDTEATYPDLTIGSCVVAKEYIYNYNGTLYMHITSLSKCE